MFDPDTESREDTMGFLARHLANPKQLPGHNFDPRPHRRFGEQLPHSQTAIGDLGLLLIGPQSCDQVAQISDVIFFGPFDSAEPSLGLRRCAGEPNHELIANQFFDPVLAPGPQILGCFPPLQTFAHLFLVVGGEGHPSERIAEANGDRRVPGFVECSHGVFGRLGQRVHAHHSPATQ